MSHFYNDTSLMPILNLHSQGTVQKHYYLFEFPRSIEGFVLDKSKMRPTLVCLHAQKGIE